MKHIELEEGGSALSGYVVDASAENVEIYLSEHTEHAAQIMAILRESGETVALLRNMFVPEAERGFGAGTALVNKWLEEAERSGATAYLLISDAMEAQVEGFDLCEWYEAWGFEQTIPTTEGPLMVMPERLAEGINGVQKRPSTSPRLG